MNKINPGEAFSKIKPEWFVFVLSGGNQPSGLCVGRFVKLSRKPVPLIGISVGKDQFTHDLIKSSKEFVVAIPNKDTEKYVEVFGKQSGRDINKFEVSKIKTVPAKHIKTPLMEEATINFECKLVEEVGVGTSTLFIGEVLEAYINQGKKILYNFGKGYGDYDFKEL